MVRQLCAAFGQFRLIWPFVKLQFGLQFIPRWIGGSAKIVLEPAFRGRLFLLLPPFENFSPSTLVDIGRSDSPDALGVATLVVELAELLQGRPQSQHQQILLVSGLSPPETCVVGADVSNESSRAVAAMLDDAILVAHPGTVDADGSLHFAMPRGVTGRSYSPLIH